MTGSWNTDPSRTCTTTSIPWERTPATGPESTSSASRRPCPGYRARIDVLCIEETVAIVRVLEDNWGGRIDFSDFLLLIKMDGEWKGVAKVYNQNSDTIRRD